MTRNAHPAGLLPTVLCALTTAALPAWGLDPNDVATADSAGTEQAYSNAIATIESSQGAYGAGLPEALLGLGLALQSQGRHEEAIGLFKRGAHLTRINNGLYSTLQIPLLQGEIASHIASQNYSLADERQHYLYRVQKRSIASGTALTSAFLQQARWQYEAYQLGLGPQGYTRLMNMWDLYRLALNDVIAREGENSVQLLPPLYGMLQAQYLISRYQGDDNQDQGNGDDVRARQGLHRFTAYRAQSYQKGNSVITAIYDIEQQREPGSPAALKALVMRGDWHLWNRDRDAARETYAQVETELAQCDDAQTLRESLFGQPVALPDINGLRPLPPTVDPEQADILLEFGVSERGRVTNLERLDENQEWDRQANHLMRELRHTKFRPRIEAGQPVGTEKLVKAFNVQ